MASKMHSNVGWVKGVQTAVGLVMHMNYGDQISEERSTVG